MNTMHFKNQKLTLGNAPQLIYSLAERHLSSTTKMIKVNIQHQPESNQSNPNLPTQNQPVRIISGHQNSVALERRGEPNPCDEGSLLVKDTKDEPKKRENGANFLLTTFVFLEAEIYNFYRT